MKIENEVTGEIAEEIESYVGIRLHICGDITDFFAVDTKEKEIITRLNATTKILLKIEHTFEDYMKLIEDLGLEIPESYKKHWKPTLKDGTLWCYFVNSVGEIEGNSFSNSTFDNELVANFNIFPNKELAEKAVNLSKLGRLILLWQYANDCLFEPDWKQDTEKWFLSYDIFQHQLMYEVTSTMHTDLIYFETKTQLEKFGDMNGMEILRLLLEKIKQLREQDKNKYNEYAIETYDTLKGVL